MELLLIITALVGLLLIFNAATQRKPVKESWLAQARVESIRFDETESSRRYIS